MTDPKPGDAAPEQEPPVAASAAACPGTKEGGRHLRRNFIGSLLCLLGLIGTSIYGMQTDSPQHYWLYQLVLRASVAAAMLTVVVGLLVRHHSRDHASRGASPDR